MYLQTCTLPPGLPHSPLFYLCESLFTKLSGYWFQERIYDSGVLVCCARSPPGWVSFVSLAVRAPGWHGRGERFLFPVYPPGPNSLPSSQKRGEVVMVWGSLLMEEGRRTAQTDCCEWTAHHHNTLEKFVHHSSHGPTHLVRFVYFYPQLSCVCDRFILKVKGKRCESRDRVRFVLNKGQCLRFVQNSCLGWLMWVSVCCLLFIFWQVIDTQYCKITYLFLKTNFFSWTYISNFIFQWNIRISPILVWIV